MQAAPATGALTQAPAQGRQARVGAVLLEGGGLALSAPLWAWWAVWEGGYPATVWLPGVVYLAAVAVVLAFGLPRPRLALPGRLALGGVGGLAAWSALSMTWAGDAGNAWNGAERAVLMLLAVALPLLWPPSRRALLAGVLAWIAAALLGTVVGIVATLGDVAEFALEGRLIAPTGYPNATAALAVMGAAPALVLAARRELPAWIRCPAFAAGAVLAATLGLSQSRGAVAVALAALLVALVFGPGRMRLGATVLLAAIVVAPFTGPLLDARTGARAGDGGDALRSALWALAMIGALALAVAYAAVGADRRWRLPARTRRALVLATAAGVALAVAGGAVAFVATQGDPVAWADQRIDDFRTPDYTALEQSDNRFTGSLGSNRSDYWRVALDLVEAHPVGGVGVTNFGPPFLERRRARTAPLYAHSIWLEIPATLGLVGAALLALALVGGAWALWARRRALDVPGRALQGAAVMPLVCLGIHASADWVSFFAGLSVPALGLAAAAAAVVGADPPPRRRRLPLSAAVAMSLVVAAVAATAVPLYLSGRLTARASATWTDRPVDALADLDRAAELDPLSDVPLLYEGIVAVELGELGRARAAYAEALERRANDWYAALMLAAIDRAAGRERSATRWLARARALNPGDRTARDFDRAVRAGAAVAPKTVQRRALADA